jgi:hypothetical protein
VGRKTEDEIKEQEDEKDINYRKNYWLREWSIRDPAEQHWHLGPIGVLPSHRRLGLGFLVKERTRPSSCRLKPDDTIELDSKKG